MVRYNSIYLWDVFAQAKSNDVYILDRETLMVHKANDLRVHKLIEIVEHPNGDNRYSAWVAEKMESADE